jgi:hypothetical protein
MATTLATGQVLDALDKALRKASEVSLREAGVLAPRWVR